MRAGPPEAVLEAMTGLSRGANMTIARTFPWASYRTYVDVGTAQGDLAAQIRAGQPAPDGAGLGPRSVGRFSRVRRRTRPCRPPDVRAGQLLHGSAAQGRRHPDGPYPARLGPVREEDADRQGLRSVAQGRRARRLRIDHRQRSIQERLWADDEPQHADRDAGRLRLHRRRLRRLDEGRRLHVDTDRAVDRARLDGVGIK